MTIRTHRILPADRIVVPKSIANIVQHHAIYLGQNYKGVDLIAENVIGLGVRLISAEEFFKDVTIITRIERFTGSNNERRQAVTRALARLGQPYNLINFNCESFSNHVQHNIVESKQVKAGLFVGLLALILGISLSNS